MITHSRGALSLLLLLPLVATLFSSSTSAQTKVNPNQIQTTWAAPLSVTGNVTATAGQNQITVYSLNGDEVMDNNKYTTVQAAVNVCPGAGCIIRIPSGTWAPAAANTALTINQSNVHIICSGFDASTISYTGSSSITAVLDIGTSTSGSPSYGNISINGCTISGNANAQYAIRLRSIHRSDFSHNKLINVTAAGIQTNFAVADTFDDLHTSSQEQAFTATPANCMVLDGPDNSHKTTATVIKNPICEGVSGTGIVLGHVATITVMGGTSEQNNKGITLSANALACEIMAVDLEANTLSNIEDSGVQNHFLNVNGNGLYHVFGTAQDSSWTGQLYDSFTIDSSALNTHLNHLTYNNSGSGTLTDNGTATSYLNVVNAGSGGSPYIANKFPSSLTSTGTQATLSGTGACASLSVQKGGAWAGQVSCGGATGASTLVITPGTTAPNGWSCWANDITHTLAGSQSTVSTTACTMSFTSVTTNDAVTFGAVAY